MSTLESPRKPGRDQRRGALADEIPDLVCVSHPAPPGVFAQRNWTVLPLPPPMGGLPLLRSTHPLHSQPPASGPLERTVSSIVAPHQHLHPDQLSPWAKEQLSHLRDESGSPGLKYASLLGVNLRMEFGVFLFFVLKSQMSTLQVFSLCHCASGAPGASLSGVMTCHWYFLCCGRGVTDFSGTQFLHL